MGKNKQNEDVEVIRHAVVSFSFDFNALENPVQFLFSKFLPLDYQPQIKK